MEMTVWDEVVIGALANEPGGVLEADIEQALPVGVASRWLADASRRGLVERAESGRWTLTARGRASRAPSSGTIVVGLPSDASRD